MKGIADSLRCRGHPCDKKKLAMLRFIFVFRNFLRMQAFCEVSENKKSEALLHSFLLRRERERKVLILNHFKLLFLSDDDIFLPGLFFSLAQQWRTGY